MFNELKNLFKDKHNFAEWPINKRAASALLLVIISYTIPLILTSLTNLGSSNAKLFVLLGLSAFMLFLIGGLVVLLFDIKYQIIKNHTYIIIFFLVSLAIFSLFICSMMGTINSNATVLYTTTIIFVYLFLGIKYTRFWYYISLFTYIPYSIWDFFYVDLYAWYINLFFPDLMNPIMTYKQMGLGIPTLGLFTFIWIVPAYIAIKIIENTIQKKDTKLESIRKKLQKYLSPQLVKSIESDTHVDLGDYKRKFLTIFFSDIQGFTAMTDSMEAESMASLLNRYLEEMSKIALKFGGTIDKFIGDAVMIFFGDPESNGYKKDALNCVNMALEMKERLHELRQEWAAEGIKDELYIRIGISSGYSTVGNFGCDDRLDYTVIGREVNLASRLESSAEANEILVSHATYALIRDEINAKKKTEIKVKGFQNKIIPYSIENAKEHKIIEKVFEGFQIKVDIERISSKDKEKVLIELNELKNTLNEND